MQMSNTSGGCKRFWKQALHIHYSYSLKVTTLSIFQNFWVDTTLIRADQFINLLCIVKIATFLLTCKRLNGSLSLFHWGVNV